MRVAKYNTAHPRGEEHHKSEYESEIVDAVLADHDDGLGYKRLAMKYGISQWTIRDWCTFRTRQYG